MVLHTVLLIIASQNFRDEELFDTKKALESHRIKTVIASSSLNESQGMLGGKAKPDILLSDVKPENYDALAFIGGSGASEYWDDKVSHKLINDAAQQNKTIAAICIAPVTLAKAGVLNGKKFTVWASEANTIKKLGGIYVNEPLVVDGNIITANGPSAAKSFGKAIAEALKH